MPAETPTDLHVRPARAVPPAARAHGAPRLRGRRVATPADLAAIVTLLVSLGTALVLSLPLGRGPAFLRAFTPEHVQLLGMVDNTATRTAHKAALLLLLVLSAAGAVWAGRRARSGGASRLAGVVGRALRLAAVAGIAAAAAAVIYLDPQAMLFGAPAGRRLRLALALVAVALFAAAVAVARRGPSRALAVVAWACVAGYALFLVVPGFMHPVYGREPLLTAMEWHYSVAVAQGDRLAAGLRLGSQVGLDYGLIPPLFLGGLERAVGLLPVGAHVRVVQASQVLFLLAACAAFALWRPRSPLFLLFAVLLVGPWVSTSHIAIYHPNQAGWRHLGLAAAVLLLLWARRQPLSRAALTLGAGAGFLLLYNPETGVCIVAGFGIYLLSRLPAFRPAAVGALVVRAAAAAAAAVLVAVVAYRLALGEFPAADQVIPLGFISRFGQGYGSLPLYFDPLAAVVFLFCVYRVAVSALRWRRGLTADQGVSLAVAVIALVWFAYYANRPHPWNLWTFTFLFAFVAADAFDPRRLRRLARRGRMMAAEPDVAAVVLVVLPLLLFNNLTLLGATRAEAAAPPGPLAAVSGMRVPRPAADSLLAQAAFVDRQDSAGTLYLTRHAYSMALLAHRFVPLPVQDPFGETITRADFERLIGAIEARAPRLILFDAPGPRAAAEGPRGWPFYIDRFYGRVKARIAPGYRRRGVQAGWEVWERRPAGAAPAAARVR